MCEKVSGATQKKELCLSLSPHSFESSTRVAHSQFP
jgi:hypothetical protein